MTAAAHHGGLDALAQLPALIGVLLFLWAGQQDGARRRRRQRERWRR